MDKQDFKRTVFSLSERLFPMVSRILGSSENAEDALQEIMMKLWLKRKEIEKHPNIKGFVFLTARNYCIDVLRKKMNVVADSNHHLQKLHTVTSEGEFAWNELQTIVEEILKEIPKLERTVFIMRELDGLEFSEIAAATSLKTAHIRVLVSRARKKVSSALEKNYNYEKGNY